MEKISDYVLHVLCVIIFSVIIFSGWLLLKLVIEQCLEYNSIDATTVLIKLKLSDKPLIIFPPKNFVMLSFLPVPVSQI